VNHLPVVDDGGEPLGVLCACDLHAVRDDEEVVDCMSAPPVTIDANASLPDAAQMLCALDIGALLVLEGPRLLGIVTRGDFRRAGLLSDLDFPRCGICHGRHHVRIDPHTGAAVCLACQDTRERTLGTGA
jgi:CBS domain-containing protein